MSNTVTTSEGFKLNELQEYAFKQAMLGRNIFVSGPGGTGKSVLANKIRSMKEDSCIVVAPTGIAALNVKGATINRTFLLPLGIMTTYNSVPKPPVRALFSDDTIKTIIIDEPSMIRADMFTAMDKILRSCKKNNKPFGGLQVLIFGDFYQLSPVLTRRDQPTYEKLYDSVYCFNCPVWQELGLETIELTQVMRQSDEHFIGLLNSIRTRDEKAIESLYALNEHALSNENVDEDNAIFLCSTNKDADTINQSRLSMLPTTSRTYTATKTGTFTTEPAPYKLELKVGAKVVITVNGDNYVNGSRGEIVELRDNTVLVKLDGHRGDIVHLSRNKWEEKEYKLVKRDEKTEGNTSSEELDFLAKLKEEFPEQFDDSLVEDRTDNRVSSTVLGTFEQFPLKLGYASTVHKSQGCSFDNVIIHNGRGFFTHGQLYVALSRVRSLEGLGFMNVIKPNEMIMDPDVKEFYERSSKMNLLGAMV